MRFLADESCDFVVVQALRADGHDVTTVVQLARGAADAEVMVLADQDNRVLLTEDKDFGQIFYAETDRARTVVLIRFPSALRGTLASTMSEFIHRWGEQITGCFVVIQPGRVRIVRRPGT